ncbi:hypothetical protein SNEBB_003589 [Seison nebaliae]|nr:hypothetical protein SNEBB_003589 [Seison nebaliae]
MKLKDDSIVYYIGKKDADSIHIREDKKHTNCLNDTLRLSPSNNNFIATQLFEKKQAKDWKTVLAQRQNVSILTDALIHQVRNLHQKEETIQKQHQNLMQLPSTFIQSISREYLNEEKVSFNSSTSKMREDFRMDLIQSCIERSRSLEENTEIKNISIDHMNLNIKTCHMMKQRRHICCTKLGSLCEHRIDVKLFMKYCETDYADILSNNSNHRIILKQLEELIPIEIRTYKSYGWKYNSILLINSRCGSAIFNLLFPLRAASLSKETLRPIILILERPPTNYFLRIISQLPMVYWNYGSIRDMEILLESGILDTQTIIVLPEDRSQLVHESIEHIVEDRSMEIRKWNEDKIPENFLHLENRLLHVEQLLRTINRRITFGNLDDILSTLSHLRQEHNDSHHGDSDDPYQEECLKDVKNILGIQTLLQRFPHLNIVTELRNPMNMRFLNSSSNLFSRLLEKQEKIHYDSHNYMKYLWKAPFVSGKVYSTVMLESFLYRSFEKQYLISLIRLLLDLDHNEHSANLTSIIVKEVDAANCYYSQLFTHLVMNEGTIPIGLCRRIVDNNDNQILRKSVSIPHNSYKNEKLNEFDIQFSYEYRGDLSSLVLVNPPSNTQLIEGDVIFILKATDRDMEKERGESYLPNKNN